MAVTEERIALLEQRLDRIEQLLRLQLQSNTGPATSPEAATLASTLSSQSSAAQRHVKPRPVSNNAPPSHPVTVTQVLGWTGATALVLAAVFLIRLVLDAGWLTPERQIGLALIGSFALIAVGLRLRKIDLEYASLLPAAGVVVLFSAVYGAHLYYHLIGATVATNAVIAICLFTLWLGRQFDNEMYALFAVIGSYSAPLLLPTLGDSVTDLIVYFSGWSVVYCAHSAWIGNRRPYLLAGYMAFIGFHIAAAGLTANSWSSLFAFQTIQFLIFVCGTLAFSIHQKRAMAAAEAIAHLPLLLIFYFLQYALLHEHVPTIAPWIALASAAVLLLAHLVARRVIKQATAASNVLVGTYVSLVLFHAGYIELVPDELGPWVALLILPAFALFTRWNKDESAALLPYKVLIGVIFAINFLRVIEASSLEHVAGNQVLALLYAAELYVAYALSRGVKAIANLSSFALFAAHIALLAAATRILDGRLQVSLAWSAIAFICLALAFSRRDKLLGQSSLLIFAASCAKVMLFDLSSASPLLRIGSLLILGGTLYVGGWMYKKVDALGNSVGDIVSAERP
ncbi:MULTISPECIES: DUF2339 domain-containing protein [unclassified Undibacterium]|uniref:DUF2339 domain-containing protein n=1 Tax=unclassified Undibacterium TaxID=2630295 RepID=UPI002AC9793C|nr:MULTISPECIES: DUF2339 domain-containing protein [unclassified Undibacterium]MEB0137465.1 DUF2339 domain-containing protein [Undibacterium sp. CCC2.1]MEB0170870.1 DUF2339 domain-containing protein [Undibacterium sp. CCC1.1]MEB0174822.1 DUF2339 domain-containing protein [Undibacterium sp. CCC3.4]MEB0214158.1 DUF2339 domain-containing protein [Undibacterium sp. 5I2]WPX44470.1 DUF2339 domain-containing protein [Undibacterium sp. CCC3.4]